MLNEVLTKIYMRDLDKLKEELNAYKNESQIWLVPDGISNSAGNLTLHLIGNLNHFIGATLGNTGYVRDRDKEFSLKNIPRAEMIASIDHTINVVRDTLTKIDDAVMDKPFPIKVPMGDDITVGFMLVHLTAHLAYHLGQINYHRRLTAK